MINRISMNDIAFTGTRKTTIQGKTTKETTDVKTDVEALQSLANITSGQIATTGINNSYSLNTYKSAFSLKDGREIEISSSRSDKPEKNKSKDEPKRMKKQIVKRTIEIKTKLTENKVEKEVNHIIEGSDPKTKGFFNNVFRKLVKLNQAPMLTL